MTTNNQLEDDAIHREIITKFIKKLTITDKLRISRNSLFY